MALDGQGLAGGQHGNLGLCRAGKREKANAATARKSLKCEIHARRSVYHPTWEPVQKRYSRGCWTWSSDSSAELYASYLGSMNVW